MDLTERQIQIITHLRNYQDWISSEKIANLIQTNKRTVQIELKELMENLEIDIITNKQLGYKLENLTEGMKKKLSNHVGVQKVYASMNERASNLIIFLLFQSDYVSMQKLADVFFLSKTAISLEIRTIQRWLYRRPHLELDISGYKGVKIISTEDSKRIFASLVSNELRIQSASLPQNIVQRFNYLYPKIKKLLQNFLLEKQYIVSGEDFYRFGRYITFIIIRSEIGFNIDCSDKIKCNEQDKLEKFVQLIEKETGYRFSSEEKYFLVKHFLELNQLDYDMSNNQDLYSKLAQFETKIAITLGIPKETINFRTDSIVNHIKTMLNRIESGNNILNHFASKTLHEFPLEAYLIRKIFPEVFEVLPNLAESSYLVLYLGDALRKYKRNVKVLLLTNHSTSMINSTHYKINEMLNFCTSTIQTEPLYQFETHPETFYEYDIHLSTEQEILFRMEDFVYLPSLMSKEEQKELATRMQKLLWKKENQLKIDLLKKYFPNENKFVMEDKSIEPIFTFIKDPVNTSFPINDNTLFVCNLFSGEKTFIKQYELKHRLKIDHRDIKRIIFAQYNDEFENIFTFFQTIAEYIF